MKIEILNEYIDAIILNILKKKESNGYSIIKTIFDKFDNKNEIKKELIYLAFKRIEKMNLINSYWIDNEFGNRVKIYSITNEGKVYLKNKKKEWNDNKTILDKLLGEK